MNAEHSMPARSRFLKRAGVGIGLATMLALGWLLMTRNAKHDAQEPAAPTMSEMDMAGMKMSSGGHVQLSPEQMRTFGVSLATAEMRTLLNEIRAAGMVRIDETRVAAVAPRMAGFVEELHVDFTGQPVRHGQPLLAIYSAELLAAQQELLLAAQLQRAAPPGPQPGAPVRPDELLAAARQRLRLWDITDAQIDDILRRGEVQRTLTLFSPAAGVVIEKQVVRGQAVQPGQTLYTIADLARVWVEAELRETDAGLLQVGATAVVELAAYPGQTFTGRVDYLYPTLQRETRTLKARIVVPNGSGRLKPDMFATVRITVPAHRALTIPASAIIDTGERKLVFVDMGLSGLMPHEVETGATAGGFVEVLSGVSPGMRVVASAQFLIDSEANLSEVMRSMMSQMSTPDVGRMQMPERR